MTFNQLKEYHLKYLSISLKSGKKVEGIIVSHQWNKEVSEVYSFSLLSSSALERIICAEISEIKILYPVKL